MARREKVYFIFSFLCLLPFSQENCFRNSLYGEQTNDCKLHGFQIQTVFTQGLVACYQSCLRHGKCESINFDNTQKPLGACEINNERSSEYHQLIHRPGYIFVQAMIQKPPSSCAEVLRNFPSSQSGYYWIQIGNVKVKVYCDMERYGGGWTLVVSISSDSNDHLQRAATNCWDPDLCVPFLSKTTRKLSDEYIHHLANCEGSFRVDVYQKTEDYTVFYKIPQGSKNFDSACRGCTEYICPRIIVSHHYPYKWETSTCTSLDQGYQIYNMRNSQGHRVFDNYDNNECGDGRFKSSLAATQRALYGYTWNNNTGIYHNKNGMLYVK